MKNFLNKKEVISNILYSFISFALPTAVLQFVVQPIIAKYLGSVKNGQYLTIMAFNYFVIGITATVLNNVRLLQQKKYDEKKYRGDFNIILIIYIILISFILPVVWYFYTKDFKLIDICLMLIVSFMYLYHDYIFVEYRIKLQYNKILINNILMTIGYISGLLLFIKIRKWQLVFIGAYFLPTIYDLFNTSFWKEPLKKTPLFNVTLKKIAKLTCSNTLGSAPSYCDKFILYPLIGGEGVSIYNSASIVGKLLLLVSAPLNSVFLSYIVKIKELKVEVSLKKFIVILIGFIVIYFGCIFLGYPLISFLYPEWAIESKKYIPITVAISLFTLISNLLNTIIVRFQDLIYQIIIEICSTVIYFIFSLVALYFYGLYGFCIALALVAMIKTIVMVIFILKSNFKC